MNSINFFVKYNAFKKKRRLYAMALNGENITKEEELKKILESDDIQLNLKIYFAAKNNKIDFLKQITNEQLNSILLKDVIDYKVDLSIYEDFINSVKFNKRDTKFIKKIIKDGDLLLEEKIELLKKAGTLSNDFHGIVMIPNSSLELEKFIEDTMPWKLIAKNYDALEKKNYRLNCECLLKEAMIKNEKGLIINFYNSRIHDFFETNMKFLCLTFEDVMRCSYMVRKDNTSYYTKNGEKDISKARHLDFTTKEIIIGALNQYVENFEQMINTNSNFRKVFFEDLKKNSKYYLIGFNDNIINILYKMPEFKEIMEDPQNIYSILNERLSFFEHLTDSNKYLIAYANIENLYSDDNTYGKEDIKNLYKKYYSKALSEEEIDELLEYSCSKNPASKSKNYGIKEILCYENIEYILKKLEKDSNYYKKIGTIKDYVFDGKLANAISFSKRYNDTKLYKDILDRISNNGSLDETLKVKIKYLSERAKLTEIKTLEQLEEKNIEELKNEPAVLETTSKLVKSQIKGSGDARTNSVIFQYAREIIIIEKESEPISICALDKNHEGILFSRYKDRIKKINGIETYSVYELACEAARNLNDIVCVLEGETFLIYMPKNITVKQKDNFEKLINSANKTDNILIESVIIDGEDVYEVDEVLKLEDYGSEKFFKYINIINKNKKEKNKTSIDKMTKEALSSYGAQQEEVGKVGSIINDEKKQQAEIKI